MALMLPPLRLSERERSAAVDILHDYLNDCSSMVKTCAMQALVDLACEDRSLLPRALPLLERLTEDGTPALRARGRKLFRRLKASPTTA